MKKRLSKLLAFYLSLIEDKEYVDSFEKLYYEHKDRMFNIAVSITKNQHLAEDALQNAFFIIARNIEKIKTDEPKMLKVFLYKVIKNASLDILRKENKIQFIELELIENSIADEDISKDAENKEAVEKIKNCILSLPQNYRDTLSLHFLFDLNSKEISKILNIPHNTVLTRLKRGGRILKSLLKGEFFDD